MSYTIEQRIGDHTYLYEVESFWDPEKKQPRQRRKYLGKKGPETGKPVRPRSQNTPHLCKDYGHVYLLQTIANQLGLTLILKRTFSEDYQILLALAFFEISEAAPLYLFPYWRDATGLENLPLLRSKDLSHFTQRVVGWSRKGWPLRRRGPNSAVRWKRSYLILPRCLVMPNSLTMWNGDITETKSPCPRLISA